MRLGRTIATTAAAALLAIAAPALGPGDGDGDGASVAAARRRPPARPQLPSKFQVRVLRGGEMSVVRVDGARFEVESADPAAAPRARTLTSDEQTRLRGAANAAFAAGRGPRSCFQDDEVFVSLESDDGAAWTALCRPPRRDDAAWLALLDVLRALSSQLAPPPPSP